MGCILMYFKCDTSGITLPQLTAATAISTLFHEQNMKATVLELEPLTFEVKAQLTGPMLKRLIVDRVPLVIHGYSAQMLGGNLVISNESAQPAKRSRQRAS